MSQEVYKNTTEFIWYWPSTPDHGACNKVWVVYKRDSVGGEVFPLQADVSCV